MRVPWRASACLLALVVISAVKCVEESHEASVARTASPARYQRKVLAATRRTPVTTLITGPPPAAATRRPPFTTLTTGASPAAATSPAPAPVHRARPVKPAVQPTTKPVIDEGDVSENSRAARSAASANDQWMQFVSDYARSQDVSKSFSSLPQGAIKVDIPVGGDPHNRPATVPVLVVPVPVPIPSYNQGCSVNQDKSDNPRFSQDVYRPRDDNRNPTPTPPSWQLTQARQPATFDDSRRPSDYDRPRRPSSQTPYVEPHRPVSYDGTRRPADQDRRPAYDEPRRPQRPQQRPQQQPQRPAAFDDGDYDEPAYPSPSRPLYQQPSSTPDYLQFDVRSTFVPPPTMPQGNSQLLLELFRAQTPSAPHLPPVLIRERRYDAPEETPRPAPAPAAAPRTPTRPRFDRPLLIKGELTVHRADYTEPYIAWWDSSTGTTRVEMHDGATNTHRMMTPSGQVQRVAMSIDRSGEKDVVRCAVMAPSPATAADRAPPVLPDMQAFSFDGYVQMGETRAERWRQTVTGRGGELGGARGEALTFRHEMLLARGQNDSAVPLMYKVGVDSSVLGEECDGYVHRYREVREQQPEPHLMHIDIEKSCEAVEQTEELSRVEPLREFTLLRRDPRHDRDFAQFSTKYERQYSDPTEEAVRKNLFTQTNRFVSSGNRMGATFKMALNFLSDRLDAELTSLLGVVLDDEHFPAESFPHARATLRNIADKLPSEFDWRERGGVTPVRYQGSCSSCWAFAVAGAVEGALFRRTRRLVALSEQCLVDCAQPYGGRGCGGTWPSHAYDYIQDRGLPALEEYTPYQAKVQQCQDKRVPPVTQISAHVNVTQHSVPALKVAIRKHAPTVVIIDAMLKSFQTYKSGIFYDDRCAKTKKKLKHAVLAVGWGEQKGEPHFILKNSWSAAWGDGGFIRVHGPSNTCGVLTLPSYPRLEDDDVLRFPAGAGRSSGAGPAADRGDNRDYD